ncbi:MAG: hypothetical protein A3J24_04150 [Deltaproteobacteria bacterium RIFCSPLOWO2_02_FULL_53_8]|nr:MAG: hypothetical protein A3J24_04150 [Deltaproteobacteria bacterium RIFCSPLOWO2_02_FULL_53_8]
MPYDTPDTHDDGFAVVGAAGRKAGLISVAAGLAAMLVGLVTGTTVITGLAAGYIVGAVNLSWLLRILRRGVSQDAKRAAASVARGYYVRFGATCLVFYLAVSRGWFNPWQLLIGFSVAVFFIIATLIFAASSSFRQTGDTDPELKNAFKQRG